MTLFLPFPLAFSCWTCTFSSKACLLRVSYIRKKRKWELNESMDNVNDIWPSVWFWHMKLHSLKCCIYFFLKAKCCVLVFSYYRLLTKLRTYILTLKVECVPPHQNFGRFIILKVVLSEVQPTPLPPLALSKATLIIKCYCRIRRFSVNLSLI